MRKLPLLEIWVHHSVRETFTTDTNALQYTVTGKLSEKEFMSFSFYQIARGNNAETMCRLTWCMTKCESMTPVRFN